MKVIELRDKLNKLMEECPACKNENIYLHTWCYEDEILDVVDKLDIEFDLNDEGRWITIQC